MTTSATATQTAAEFVCPTHSAPLIYVLKGGVGYCPKCRLYVQAAGVPMPARPAKNGADEATPAQTITRQPKNRTAVSKT